MTKARSCLMAGDDTLPQQRCQSASLALFEDPFLLQHLARDAERLDPCGYPRIDRDLDQRVANLLRRTAIANRAAHVQLEFGRAIQRRDDAQVVQAALVVGEDLARPHLAPAGFGDNAL